MKAADGRSESARRVARSRSGRKRQIDTAMLRRCLVDAGLLSRAEGFYWRTGGWVDVGS